jgi:hypothetical protein
VSGSEAGARAGAGGPLLTHSLTHSRNSQLAATSECTSIVINSHYIAIPTTLYYHCHCTATAIISSSRIRSSERVSE